MSAHQPVLMSEVLEGLALKADARNVNGRYVDGTYGRGGHSAGILGRLGAEGRLLALDKDPEAVADGRIRFAADPRFTIRHAGFEDFRAEVAPWLGSHPLAGVLLDLGVSSPQLDEARRGFSFSQDGPLDMRMNPASGPTAAEWLAGVDETELAGVLRRYGEEPRARAIARAIIRARELHTLTRTGQLAEIVAAAAGPRPRKGGHPATRVFQAIRIHLNRELEALEQALSQCVELLGAGGRLVVISFHSLEDRIVKRYFASAARGDPAWAGLPDMPAHARPTLTRVGGLVRPGEDEIAANPRARSARLRVAEKLAPGSRA
jgi:16S rRNA (cytosine1402-N4)-methyltransferase